MTAASRRASAGAALLLLALAKAGRPADFSQAAVGSSGSQFLTIDAGARGAAMAGAYSALSDDAFSMYWNPAGLANIQDASLGLMSNQYLAGINYYYAAYAHRLPASAGGVLGASLRYLDVGNITQTDVDGATIGTFHPRSFAYELGYGRPIEELENLADVVLIGASVRYIRSNIAGATASALAGDIGVQVHSDSPRFFPYHYGVVAQNLGKGQKFDQQRDPLPTQARLGGAVDFSPEFTLSAEGVIPNSNSAYGLLGTELSVRPFDEAKISFRGGVQSNSFSNGVSGFRGFDFGIGLMLSRFSFDYAFVPYGNLGNTNTFSLTVNFGAPETKKYRER